MKAFLSHSSTDRLYVESVARRLDRVQVTYDAWHFQPGEDFRDSIRDELRDSDVFVLFASEASLNSAWVQFEFNEAELRLLRGQLKDIIVFTLGDSIHVQDLPEWMSRGLVIHNPSPSQAARIIQERLLMKNGSALYDVYLGREADKAELTRDLIALGGKQPRALAIVGLEGVGRKTFTAHTLKDTLGMSFGPVSMLVEAHTLLDLYLDLLEETTVFEDRQQLERAIEVFQRADLETRQREVAQKIAAVCKVNHVVVVVDRGAMLDETGYYRPEFSGVLRALGDYPGTFLVLVHTRYPHVDDEPDLSDILLRFKLNPLRLEETRLLLARLLQFTGVEHTEEQVNELALYLDGFPLAIHFAVRFARRYGLAALVADKSVLQGFKTRKFAKMLQKMDLDPESKYLLQILCTQPILPLSALAALADMTESDVSRRVRWLMDHCLVVNVSGMYAISGPMRAAVDSVFGVLLFEAYTQFAERLRNRFWSDPEQVPSLAIIDATINALLACRSPHLEEFKGLVLPSNLLKAARDAYNNSKWELAKDLASRTLKIDPERNEAREVLFKALVRLAQQTRQWAPAEAQLAEINRRGMKSRHYLAGFLAWKKREFSTAIKHFRTALSANDRSVSVYRDLAECLYRAGETESAYKTLRKAIDPQNRYVLFLAATLAIELENFGEAWHHLETLEGLSRPEELAFLKSMYHARRRNWTEALKEADTACKRQPPPFRYLLQRADLLVEAGRFSDAAASLEALSNDFRGVENDAQLAVQCKLHIRQRHWRQAEACYQQLSRKDTAASVMLRRLILSLKVEDHDLGLVERTGAQQELAHILETKLKEGADGVQLLVDDWDGL